MRAAIGPKNNVLQIDTKYILAYLETNQSSAHLLQSRVKLLLTAIGFLKIH
jgi:hypothetical protein